METSPLFMGSPWMALDVRPDGSCRHWQSIVKEPRPCKHIRCTVRWHVTLMRRVRALRRRAKDGDILRAIG
jgi:hypothetical protein